VSKLVNVHNVFRKFATKTASIVGSPWTFIAALIIISVWIITGPIFNYSNTWQLAINTFTTISTFLTVFLIQNTQNRDAKATHLKLDELLKSVSGARNQLVNIEEVSDEELDKLHLEFQKLHTHYENEVVNRKKRARIRKNN
jgi:low affinity Fe/Cu permease